MTEAKTKTRTKVKAVPKEKSKGDYEMPVEDAVDFKEQDDKFGESYHEKNIVKEVVNTEEIRFSDNAVKIKYIRERTYANGVRKNRLMAMEKVDDSGRRFIFDWRGKKKK